MPPSATETVTTAAEPVRKRLRVTFGAYKDLDTNLDVDAEVGKGGYQAAKYPHYLPTWNPDQKYPPLEPFEHHDHGKDADPTFPDLLPEGVVATKLTPTIGTEVHGIQLSTLNNAAKDQLARFVAERKVVVFRDQDFADLPIQGALDYAAYFGRHHIHPTSGSPEGYPEVHLVHRSASDKSIDKFLASRTSSVAWHSDVSYEQQPPGTTFLYILDKPAEAGGDTVFVNTAEAYARLSPLFQARLHGLRATHSGVEQVDASMARQSVKRRDPVTNDHPIVRTHPVTGEKAIYVNPQFTRDIVGLKKEESDVLLKFLYDHLAFGADFQARVRWEEKTVVVWDNRVTQHTALVDFSAQRRHLARITPQAERPFETRFSDGVEP